jgi:hypothetical protein
MRKFSGNGLKQRDAPDALLSLRRGTAIEWRLLQGEWNELVGRTK